MTAWLAVQTVTWRTQAVVVLQGDVIEGTKFADQIRAGAGNETLIVGDSIGSDDDLDIVNLGRIG